jgi:hypothetical protein
MTRIVDVYPQLNVGSQAGNLSQSERKRRMEIGDWITRKGYSYDEAVRAAELKMSGYKDKQIKQMKKTGNLFETQLKSPVRTIQPIPVPKPAPVAAIPTATELFKGPQPSASLSPSGLTTIGLVVAAALILAR